MIAPGNGYVLALNAGSSSLKFAVFHADDLSRSILSESVGSEIDPAKWLDWVREKTAVVTGGSGWTGVGHRVVHGGPRFAEPQLITPDVLAELKKLIPF